MTFGEVANQAVKGLSASPALLLIACLNFIMIFGVGYVAKSQVEERRALAVQQQETVKLLLSLCKGT